jgi:hypothetical protein
MAAAAALRLALLLLCLLQCSRLAGMPPYQEEVLVSVHHTAGAVLWRIVRLLRWCSDA